MDRAITRRQAIVGVTTATATTAMSGQAVAFWPWWSAFSAAVAAGWLVEALKNWGMVPQANAATAVGESHEREALPLQQEGYAIRPIYKGAYRGGDFELSEATRRDQFLALSTTSHDNNTCTNTFESPDAINLGLVARALRSKGYYTDEVQAAALPIHPPGRSRYLGERRQSPTFMTPSHGTIAWSTDASSTRGNFVTAIRSPIVHADLRFAQLDSGKWTFAMDRG